MIPEDQGVAVLSFGVLLLILCAFSGLKITIKDGTLGPAPIWARAIMGAVASVLFLLAFFLILKIPIPGVIANSDVPKPPDKIKLSQFRVCGVPIDDADGGLVVRTGPGKINDEVYVLPKNAEQVLNLHRHDYHGNSFWLKIEYQPVATNGSARSVTGWVNMNYLCPGR